MQVRLGPETYTYRRGDGEYVNVWLDESVSWFGTALLDGTANLLAYTVSKALQSICFFFKKPGFVVVQIGLHC
jgi:hypothetical protein